MINFRITLKNYRCFEDSQPLILDIGPGFTALVGPNNSGKSSFLKLFHELRTVFASLSVSSLGSFIEGVEVGYPGVEDALEIFYDGNSRPLVIELEFPHSESPQVELVRLTAERANPTRWRGEVWFGQPRTKLIGGWSHQGIRGPLNVAGQTSLIGATALAETVDTINRSLYIGAFRNAISEGGGSYYDLAIGTSFIDMWNTWKTGPSRAQNQVVQDLETSIAHVFGYERLEVNATGSGVRTLQAFVNGKPYRLRELGAGLAQFLVVFGNVAIKRPTWLLIDEPELNLHPSLQADFLTSIASHTSQGVMFATHSVGLARTSADRIYAFQKPGLHAIARPFEQVTSFAEFVGEMSFSSFKELGHDSILLVEGVTEVKALQQFLRVLGKDHLVVVIPLGGAQLIRGGVQAELAELKRLSTKVAVLIDSERQAAGEAMLADRLAFLQDCQALGFHTHATERRAFENYLSERAVRHVKGPNSRALGPFDVGTSWGKWDNWRIARVMTEGEVLATDVGQFLQSL